MAEGNYGIKKTDALEEQIERIKIKWHTKMETTDPSISEIFKKGLDLLEEELYTDKSKTKEYANNTAEEIAESKFKSLESWLIKLFEQGAITQELLNTSLILKNKLFVKTRFCLIGIIMTNRQKIENKNIDTAIN